MVWIFHTSRNMLFVLSWYLSSLSHLLLERQFCMCPMMIVHICISFNFWRVCFSIQTIWNGVFLEGISLPFTVNDLRDWGTRMTSGVQHTEAVLSLLFAAVKWIIFVVKCERLKTCIWILNDKLMIILWLFNYN